jgi:hypothetical protein
MDTSNFDEKQKEYINLCCDQLLEQRRLMWGYLNGYVSGEGNMPYRKIIKGLFAYFN